MSERPVRELWTDIAAGFLAISYGLGAPLTAFVEYRIQVLSLRFDLPPWLVYLTCAVQLACAVGVLVRPLASRAAAALTATTLGAIFAHLRIGSPMTAAPALVYTLIQIWFGRRRHTRARA